MVTSSHYEAHSAESYEQAYFYEPGAYMQHLVNLVSNKLRLESDTPRTILDVGGGTGNFAQALIDQNPSTKSVVVVDPFLESTSQTTSDKISFVKAPAEVFLEDPKDNDEWRRGASQVLLKEVVHHLHPKDRVQIFKGLYDAIDPMDEATPSLLIITRPQVEIDYPLWDAARKVWRENQPSAQEFQDELGQAGFVDVQETLKVFPSQIGLKRWQAMVKQRFWSTFSNFSDDELEEGCQQIAKERPAKDGVIHFEDRLIFITARKPVGSSTR
jgi:hypothetical protein